MQVRSKMGKQAFNAFKMVLTAQLKGIENAHRMAMVLLDPGGTEAAKESIEKVDLAKSNREMEFSKLILMKIMIIAANFNMSPKEAGLPEYSEGGSRMGNENPKEQIELSRKFGLMPALMAFEDVLNHGIVYKYDEDFEFRFVYDDETEAQRLDLAGKAIQQGVDSINGQRLEMDKQVIDREYLKSLGLKTLSDETIDGLVLSYNLPFTPTLMQAIGQLTPQPADDGMGGPGGPGGGPGGPDDQGGGPDEGFEDDAWGAEGDQDEGDEPEPGPAAPKLPPFNATGSPPLPKFNEPEPGPAAPKLPPFNATGSPPLPKFNEGKAPPGTPTLPRFDTADEMTSGFKIGR